MDECNIDSRMDRQRTPAWIPEMQDQQPFFDNRPTIPIEMQSLVPSDKWWERSATSQETEEQEATPHCYDDLGCTARGRGSDAGAEPQLSTAPKTTSLPAFLMLPIL